MAPRPMKVKVKTAELLKAVEAKQAQAQAAVAETQAVLDGFQAEYEAALAVYEAELLPWKDELLAALEKEIAANGLDAFRIYSGRDIRINVETIPLSPPPVLRSEHAHERINARYELERREAALRKIERTIATLKIAAEDAISISADDYAEYLGS